MVTTEMWVDGGTVKGIKKKGSHIIQFQYLGIVLVKFLKRQYATFAIYWDTLSRCESVMTQRNISQRYSTE